VIISALHSLLSFNVIKNTDNYNQESQQISVLQCNEKLQKYFKMDLKAIYKVGVHASTYAYNNKLNLNNM
jgi:hypothetical protein